MLYQLSYSRVSLPPAATNGGAGGPDPRAPAVLPSRDANLP